MTLEEKALEYSLKINGFTKEDCYDKNGELKQFIKSDMDIYLAGAEEVKADCDFALEGKDVEIKELKEVLKGLLEEEEKGLWFKADGSDKSRYYKLREKAEQFLRETDIDNAIQKANEGLDLDKIADEVEQDIKEQKVK